jgi:glycosyltransferase involved in cell wall biosynthesis
MGVRPACSVIIPTYNRMRLLARTLDSMIRQDIGRDRFEVLVVDDGSSDATAEVATRYGDRLHLRYFFQPDEGFRAAAARNVGITHAKAEVCVFIDSGVLLHSRGLSAYLRSHADAGSTAVIGYVYCFNHRNEDIAKMLVALDFDDVDGTIEALRRQAKWLDDREKFYARYGETLDSLPAPWLIYWSCNVSATTAQLRRTGGFDEAFRAWGGEDVDLGYRLHRDGAHFVLNRHASAIHYPHGKDYEANRPMQMANARYIARKYDTPITRLLAAEPPINDFDLNDYIRRHDVPACAEYLTQTRLALEPGGPE